MKKTTKGIILALSIIIGLTGCSKKTKTDSNKVRIGQLTGHVLPVVALEKGYFTAEGLTDVELFTFGAGPAEVEAFTSGDLDIINTGDLPAYNGIINGLNLRFIGTYSSSYKANGLIVRDDANIKTYSDLKGKKLAVPFGTNIQSLLYEYLDAGGLTGDDAEIINLSCADAVNAIRQKQVDAIVVWQPWLNMAESEDGITVLSYTDDFRYFVCPISVSADYLEKNPETIKKVISALDKAGKWIRDNKLEAAKLTAEYYNLDSYDSILIGLETGDPSVKLTDEKVEAIKLGAVQNYKYGILRQEINVDNYIRQDITADLK